MLGFELEQHWQREAAAWNERLKQRNAANSMRTYQGELRPLHLDAESMAFLLPLHLRDEFDGLMSGLDRHAKFARWAVEQYSIWHHEIDEARMAMFEALQNRAGSRDLKLTGLTKIVAPGPKLAVVPKAA